MKPKVLSNLPKMLSILRRETQCWKAPIVGTFAKGENLLFKVLVSTLLSLRTKDEVTEKASHRLFERAQTPQELLKLDEKEIEKIIYPVGFYRTKAKNLKNVSRILIEKHAGTV